MKFPKALTPASESRGSDEDVGEAVDGPDGVVEDDVNWEDARCSNKSRMDCNLREGFFDMVEENGSIRLQCSRR